jgi:hypothetical protein
MRLTENFEDSEFECRCGCGLNNISMGIVNRLQVVRDLVQMPIIVDCGSR